MYLGEFTPASMERGRNRVAHHVAMTAKREQAAAQREAEADASHERDAPRRAAAAAAARRGASRS